MEYYRKQEMMDVSVLNNKIKKRFSTFNLFIQPNFEALKKTCNLWRNWADIDDSWASVVSITDYFANNQDRIAHHAGPGHWNDPGRRTI